VMEAGCASSITTVVNLETSDGFKICSLPGSAQICHVDFPEYNGTSHSCGGRGCHSWKGRGHLAVDSKPPGAVRKYPHPGQRRNDLSRSPGDRNWSGAGLFPRGFPNPPTSCLKFSLWRDFVAVGGPTVGRGVAPQLWTAHPRGPPQNIPIRASNGMTCPHLRDIGIGPGRGLSPVIFPTPLLLV